jgi:hypothetical protein
LGDSVGTGPEEAPIGLWPEVAGVGEGRAPSVPGEPSHLLGLGASKVLAQSSQLEDSGACPPLGTHSRLEHSWQKSLG